MADGETNADDLSERREPFVRLRAALDSYPLGRSLDRADLPDDEQLARLLPGLAEHPRLPAVVHLLCERADAAAASSSGLLAGDRSVLGGLCEAVLDTRSPAIFGDCVGRLLSSPSALSTHGPQLATRLLDQARLPPPDSGSRDQLRAADALEAATQLRLQGFVSRFDLFALLEAISGPTEMTWSRAAVRALLACVEMWADGEELVPSLERLAGLAEPRPTHDGPTTPDQRQESDFAAALARAALLAALRCEERDLAVAHLDHALHLVRPVLTEDDRLDVEVVAAVATILRDLLLDGAVTDPDAIPRLQRGVREHAWLEPDVNHWAGGRVAAGHSAWAKLAWQLERAQQHLSEPSWYHAAAVVDDLVDLYRTSRSRRLFRRETDDDAVRAIVSPMIEVGFAAQHSLLRHLDDHVNHLQSRAEDDAATTQELADLPVAIELRDAAAERLRSGDVRPKSSAGDQQPPAGAAGSSAERVAAAVRRSSTTDRYTTGSLVADRLLERVRRGLAGTPDYVESRAEAVDLVTTLLVAFVHSRENLSPSTRPYLYKQEVAESELADDLRDFVAGSGHLGDVRTEVRDVGGGRVDVEFTFPGFNLFVELKVDFTATPLPDKTAYLKQSASYQATDVRIGFLLVLKVLKPKAVASWIGDAVDVVEVTDAAGGLRHVVAFSLFGGRTVPSRM